MVQVDGAGNTVVRVVQVVQVAQVIWVFGQEAMDF